MHLWLRLREMSSSNRHDELSDHLRFIAAQCLEELAHKLSRQFDRATSTLNKHSNLLITLRKATDMSVSEITTWYTAETSRKESQQPDVQPSLLQATRLELIKCHDDAEYWKKLMRNNEHHSYKMRTTASKHVAETSRLRAVALAKYNEIRMEQNPSYESLTMAECEAQGHLNKLGGDVKSSDHMKHQHFDSIQVVDRAREELGYTKIEIDSLLHFMVRECQRYTDLEEGFKDDKDQSKANMCQSYAESIRMQLGQYLLDLRKAIKFYRIDIEYASNVSHSVVVDSEILKERTLVGEYPPEEENDADDWDSEEEQDQTEDLPHHSPIGVVEGVDV
jgi:hypothetical protein